MVAFACQREGNDRVGEDVEEDFLNDLRREVLEGPFVALV